MLERGGSVSNGGHTAAPGDFLRASRDAFIKALPHCSRKTILLAFELDCNYVATVLRCAPDNDGDGRVPHVKKV